MESKLQEYEEKTFEDIKHIDEYGNEYWEARELQKILGYKNGDYFQRSLKKLKLPVL